MAPTVAAALSPRLEISEEAWREAGWLPCRLRAEIPVRGFTVSDVLSLEIGSLVDSGTPVEADVFLSINQARIGSAKLDLLAGRLAVRLTEFD